MFNVSHFISTSKKKPIIRIIYDIVKFYSIFNIQFTLINSQMNQKIIQLFANQFYKINNPSSETFK